MALFRNCKISNLDSNEFIGNLPANWSSAGSFPQLQNLNLGQNKLSGTLPEGWGAPESFLLLRSLVLFDTNLTGTVPARWGMTGRLPKPWVFRFIIHQRAWRITLLCQSSLGNAECPKHKHNCCQ